MSDSEHDDDFEAYLKRRVPIDQRMKSVDRLEPPPEVDRVIIGKARNAIQNSPPVPLYRAPKWALPVGLAATLLIAFSIVWDLGVRTGRHQQAISAAATTQAAASKEIVAAAPAVAATQAPAPAAEPMTASADAAHEMALPSADSAASADTSAGSQRAVAPAKTFARMQQPPPIKTAPWPPLPRPAAKPVVPSDAVSDTASAGNQSLADLDPRSRSAERRIAEKRLRRTADSEPAAAADVGSSPDPAPTLARNAAPDVVTGGLAATRVASAAGTAPVPSAAPTPAAPPPPPLVDATANAEAPTPMHLAASSPKASAVTFDGTKVIEPRTPDRFDAAAAATTERPARESPAGTTPSPAAASAADRREHPDPKAWLDQIQKLRAAGLGAQAEQEMKHFRDAYPAYGAPSPDGGAQ